MSKKNYNKISTEKANAFDEVVEDVAPETVAEEVTDAVETVVDDHPKYLEGTIVGCSKLNIRETPNMNGKIAGVENAGAIVTIFPDESTDEWYSVVTESSLDGYCMKKFISIKA